MGKYVYKYGHRREVPLRVVDLFQAIIVGLFLFMASMAGNVLSFYIARVFS